MVAHGLRCVSKEVIQKSQIRIGSGVDIKVPMDLLPERLQILIAPVGARFPDPRQVIHIKRGVGPGGVVKSTAAKNIGH